MSIQFFDHNLRSYLGYENHIINNGEDFKYYCNTSNSCHIGNDLYIIAHTFSQSLHYISECDNGSHTVQYVKNEEELKSITKGNVHPNHEDFYIHCDNNGVYFVYPFSKYPIYYNNNT